MDIQIIGIGTSKETTQAIADKIEAKTGVKPAVTNQPTEKGRSNANIIEKKH